MIETKYSGIYVDGIDVYRCIKGQYRRISKWIDCLGYYMVVFKINGKRKYVRVHRLIAQTLIPNPLNLPQVNHIDGDKLNNHIENLQWCTNSQNTQHGYDNGLYHSKHRSHPVVAISKQTGQSFQFESIRSCASSLCLNRKTITEILKRKKANNYPYEFQYIEGVSTIPDECKGVDSEISAESKREAS